MDGGGRPAGRHPKTSPALPLRGAAWEVTATGAGCRLQGDSAWWVPAVGGPAARCVPGFKAQAARKQLPTDDSARASRHLRMQPSCLWLEKHTKTKLATWRRHQVERTEPSRARRRGGRGEDARAPALRVSAAGPRRLPVPSQTAGAGDGAKGSRPCRGCSRKALRLTGPENKLATSTAR